MMMIIMITIMMIMIDRIKLSWLVTTSALYTARSQANIYEPWRPVCTLRTFIIDLKSLRLHNRPGNSKSGQSSPQ